MKLTKLQLDQLEDLLDKSSLVELLAALVMIIEEKAKHLSEIGRDESSTKTWRRDAKRLETVATRLEN